MTNVIESIVVGLCSGIIYVCSEDSKDHLIKQIVVYDIIQYSILRKNPDEKHLQKPSFNFDKHEKINANIDFENRCYEKIGI